MDKFDSYDMGQAFRRSCIFTVLYYLSLSGAVVTSQGCNSVACLGGVFEGDYEIFSPADIKAFSGCKYVRGNLTISCPELPYWEGGFKISCQELPDLAGLESLKWVAGDLSIGTVMYMRDYPDVYYGNPTLSSLSGLENLTEVEGNLQIVKNDSLNNLQGLNGLESLGGKLFIFANGDSGVGLTSLEGLEGLSYLGGDLEIYQNDSLTTLAALEGLSAVGGNVYIGRSINHDYGEVAQFGNGSLLNLAGLDGITQIGGGLFIENNSSLANIDALDNLTEMGSKMWVRRNPDLPTCDVEYLRDRLREAGWMGDNVLISGNNDNGPCSRCKEKVWQGDILIESWMDIPPLSWYTAIDGSLSITGTDARTLEDFKCLSRVQGDVVVRGNDYLKSLTRLETLQSIGGTLKIENNSALSSLSGLINLTQLGGDLTINNDPLLPTCDAENLRDRLASAGWTGQAAIAGTDDLGRCPCEGGAWFGDKLLTDPNELSGYRSIVGTLTVRDVSSLAGLECLTDITGNLEIFDNEELVDLSGLDNLSVIHGNLEFGKYLGTDPWEGGRYGNSLKNLQGLNSLRVLCGDIQVAYDGVQSLDGLDGIIALGGSLRIFENEELVSLRGLENLASVGGDLEVSENGVLASVLDLVSLTNVGGSLTIVRNPLLPQCEAEGLRDQLRAEGWDGEATINGNFPGGTCW
jgi:hypothetical protein